MRRILYSLLLALLCLGLQAQDIRQQIVPGRMNSADAGTQTLCDPDLCRWLQVRLCAGISC